MKNFQGLPVTMLILGGQLMVTLGRIHKDFARITCDNVDPGAGQLTVTLGMICEDFARITCDNVDPGGSIDGHLGKDPLKILQGLPVTMLILGGSIDSHLGKDP